MHLMAPVRVHSKNTLDAKSSLTWSQVLHNFLNLIAEEVLRTFGFWENLPRVTPMKPNNRLSKDDCDPSAKPNFHKRYRGIVGSLGYLVTMTRLDLAWSYSELSKCDQFLGQSHKEAVEHVLLYLRATWNETITYTRGSRHVNELWGWVDADWAGYTDTRQSHTGYILMMNGSPISWKSHRQDKGFLSTSEAKFVVASQAAQEVVYLRETLRDFGYPQSTATDIFERQLDLYRYERKSCAPKVLLTH